MTGDPDTAAHQWWAELLAEARATATMALTDHDDHDLTDLTPGQSDLIDLGIVAGANTTMDLLRRMGVLR